MIVQQRLCTIVQRSVLFGTVSICREGRLYACKRLSDMKKSKVEQPCPPPSAYSSLYLCLPPQMSRETPIALSHSGTPVMETRSKCSSCTHSLDSSRSPPLSSLRQL